MAVFEPIRVKPSAAVPAWPWQLDRTVGRVGVVFDSDHWPKHAGRVADPTDELHTPRRAVTTR